MKKSGKKLRDQYTKLRSSQPLPKDVIFADELVAESQEDLEEVPAKPADDDRILLVQLVRGRNLIGDISELPFDKLDCTGANLGACTISAEAKAQIYGNPHMPAKVDLTSRAQEGATDPDAIRSDRNDGPSQVR